jgi:FkbM family methyltransferase
MPKVIRRLITAITTADRLGNPFHVLRKRLLADPEDLMTIVDKDTGIHCICSVGAYPIFGETWYSRVYDVPGLPIRAGDVVLDIGANHGFFTCYAASKGATVYAFEPVPQSYKRLVANVERNGFANRVTTVQCAVSHTSGSAELLVSASKGGGDSTMDPVFARRSGVPVAESITVECKTLASILDEYAIPSARMCKIDIEGAELDLLSALKAPHRARIQGFAMEYHPQAYDLNLMIKMLMGWGSHQVCLMSERPNVANVLHLISNRALESWFEGERKRWAALGSINDYRPRQKSEVA